jgi:Fe-S cluster biogenesis protein NfuA
MDRIEELVARLEAAPDASLRGDALALVQLLLDLHRQGLARVLELVGQNGAGPNGSGGLIERHDLHPVDLSTRVEQALEKVRPLLRSHGGDVALTGMEDSVVRLKLEGSCHGCPSSTQTLRNAIEEAMYEFAPDITRLEVAGVVEEKPVSGFVPLESIRLG